MTGRALLQVADEQTSEMSSSRNDFADCLRAGLRRSEKSIPSRFFYDARGSELFEEITRQPEYYVTDAEVRILEANVLSLQDITPPGTALIELGSGSSRKTEILLSNLQNVSTYVAIDISTDALDDARERLVSRFRDLNVITIVSDMSDSVVLPASIATVPRLGFFPGSTIGNFQHDAAVRLLRSFGRTLGLKSRLVIGVDLKKDVKVLHQAYNDAAGVTADFNRNLLRRANTELGANFELEAFEHEARYDEEAGRINMFLVSLRNQTVRINGEMFDFRAGERIHTEYSHKYTVSEFQSLARMGGWTSQDTWIDDQGLFSVHVLENSK